MASVLDRFLQGNGSGRTEDWGFPEDDAGGRDFDLHATRADMGIKRPDFRNRSEREKGEELKGDKSAN